MSSKTPTMGSKNISRRHFLRASAATVGASLLAACGAGGTGTSGSATTTGGNAAAPSGGTVTINHWYHQYGEEGTQQAAQRYAQQYTEANPNVTVNVVWTPGDYGAKLNAGLLGGEGPDVFETSLNLDMVRSGQVVALDDIYGDAKADFNETGLKANTVDGKLYGVKMIDDMGLLYYRKTLVEQAGVTPPTTLDELGAAIQALSTGQVKGLFMGNDGGVGVLGDQLLWSSGHVYLSEDNKTPAFNNEETVAAFAKGQQFLTDNTSGILSGAPTDWWDPTALTSGLSAMQWTGLWAMPGIRKVIGEDFGVMAWPKPAADQGTHSTFWGGWSQFVNAKSANVEASMEYVKWLWITNKEIQKDWALAYGFHVPPRMSAAAEAEPLKSGPAKEAVDFLNQFGIPSNPSWTGAMGTAWGDAVNNILKNGADPKTELDAAAAKVQAEIDKQA